MFEWELFLDGQKLSWEHNVSRRLRHPRKYPANPVLCPQHPWEASYVTIYGSVLPRAERGWRMWYMSGAAGMTREQMMCYAESDDGLKWERVMSDRNAYHGKIPTNIVLGPKVNVHGPCVIENQHNDDPAQRLLCLFDSYPQYRPELKDELQESRWCYSASSADGVNWKPSKGKPAIPGKSDIGQSVVWDPLNNRYIAYLRGSRGINKPEQTPFGEKHAVRYVRASTSKDFVHWSEPIEIFRCDQRDGDPFHQAHQLSVTYRDGQYIGLLSIFRINEIWPLDEGAWMEEGPIDTQLMVSRDGLNWHRVADRQTFFPMGQPGQWDDHWLVTASQIVYDGERMLFYYAGNNQPRRVFHPQVTKGSEYRIGVATLQRDRFQELSPLRLDQPAVIETKPLQFPGDADLKLNADASRGPLLVELCDYNGYVIEGFSREDCDRINVDGLDLPVRWKGKRLGEAMDPSRIFQRAIRVRFYLHRSSLFAAQFPAATKGLSL